MENEFRKLSEIKTPKEWANAVTSQNINKNVPQPRLKVRGKKGIKIAAAVAAAVIAMSVCMSVGASVNDSFAEFLSGIFGKSSVTQMEIENANNKSDDIIKDKNSVVTFKEQTAITGVNESFASEYHYEGDNEIVDSVYLVRSNGLHKVTPKHFKGIYKSGAFSFDYVVNNGEIYGFNLKGNIQCVFPVASSNKAYVVLQNVENGTIKQGAIVCLDLEKKEIARASEDNMKGNFVMSPDGKNILVNHRSDEYWSVFNVSSFKEKKISPSLLNGSAREEDIVFADSTHIATYGSSYYNDDASGANEIYLIDIQNNTLSGRYNADDTSSVINAEWTYKESNGKLNFKNTISSESFDINVSENNYTIADIGSDYVIFKSNEGEGKACVIVNLEKHTGKTFTLPENIDTDISINVASAEKTLMISTTQRAYLVDISDI